MGEVIVLYVKDSEIRQTIQQEKDAGRRILALAPSRTRLGKVTEFLLVTQ